MRAVILAAGPGTAKFPLANYLPKLALPMANKPLLHHTLHYLKAGGIDEVAVLSSEHCAALRALIEKLQGNEALGFQISSFAQQYPRGTAGSLKDLADWLREAPFLVLSSNVFLASLDLAKLAAFHVDRKAGITVVVETSPPGCDCLENVQVDDQGRVDRCMVLHRSRDRRGPRHRSNDGLSRPPAPALGERRHPLWASGLYMIDPLALDHIPSNGYMDIKEQLIPALHAKDIPVLAYLQQHPLRRVDDIRAYFELHRDVLMGKEGDLDFLLRGMQETLPNVWAGQQGTEIPASFQAAGPVLIGDRCRIGDRVRVTGPTSLAEGVQLGSDVVMEECVIGPGVKIGNGTTLRRSLLVSGCSIDAGTTIEDEVIFEAPEPRRYQQLLSEGQDDGVRVNSASHSLQAVKRTAYLAAKRALDVVVSAVSLLLFLPLFALIAAAIKLDSGGPVFYVQRRCGRDGRDFPMYKFRTMVVEAGCLHQTLIAHKDIDGPMFKMRNDPRVTRVGRFLRRSSLDELPQLLNTLRGEMSLVGPRPLIMEEMEFAPHWRDLRLQVRPGITGLWQVNGRDSVSFHDWIKNDIYYVMHSSLAMDLKILLRTFKVLRCGNVQEVKDKT
ncbi:MAG TPA: sugar transferase [Thermoanaerobaculia bacterium]|nr:sugar transferase [Thermoanaerobaculia bacterium]